MFMETRSETTLKLQRSEICGLASRYIALLVSCFSWLLCFQYASGRAPGRGGRGAWFAPEAFEPGPEISTLPPPLVRQKTDGILWPLVSEMSLDLQG
jgi:hypothetical protein